MTRISFVLCTKNGGAKLRTCLDHIEAMDVGDDMDCHLVDNGSTDGISYELIQSFARSSRFRPKVYQTFKVGNSAGRNVAIPHVDGDLVLFVDDDCYPEIDFIKAWTQVLGAGKTGYGSGMIMPFDRQFSYESCNEYPFDRFIGGRQFVWRGFLTGSNMAFRRDCLNQVGLFDERLGAGTPFAAEDWDMSLRASALGWAGQYSPLPKVRHDHQRSDAAAAGRWRFYDYGAGAVYAKHSFTYRGPRIVREFVRELGRFRNEPQRRRDLTNGYVDFLRKRSRKV